jgi:ribonuclease E
VSEEDASGIAPPFEQTPAPALPEAAPMASAPQEAPRRRSTTREPAPLSGAAPSPTLPPPAPVISSTASEEGGTPKRGWWAKKLLGDKS